MAISLHRLDISLGTARDGPEPGSVLKSWGFIDECKLGRVCRYNYVNLSAQRGSILRSFYLQNTIMNTSR